MTKLLNSELFIKVKMWNNESLDLIDFHKYNYDESEIKIRNSGTLSSINKSLMFKEGKNKEKIEKNPFELFSINHNEKNGFYYINCDIPPKELSKLSEKSGTYIVYKGNKYKNIDKILEKYYKLSQGDIIKMGKIYLKIIDINMGQNEKNKFETDFNDSNNSKASIFRCSSFRSDMINGQQIIRGMYSPSNKLKDNKCFQLVNYMNDNKNKSNISIFAGKHTFRNKKGTDKLPFIYKNSFSLNRNNSSVEDLFISSKYKKSKLNKINYEINIPKEKEKKIKLSLLNNKILYLGINEKINTNKKPKVCRICYGKDTNIENPLICPCTCKGSMKYIHYQCLKNWLNSKIEAESSLDSETEEVGITYCCKDLSCELCKTKFPDYLNHKGKIYNITFYKPKFKQFIIFESMRADKLKTKFIHILSFDNKNQIALGRANDCDLSFPELSVSRYHCFIHKDINKLYLEDNNSKFGTLVLLQNPNILMIDNSPLRLQKKRVYLKIKLLIPSSIFSCCNANTFDSKIFSYQAQNQKYFDIISSFVIKNDISDLNENDIESEENEIQKVEDNEILYLKNNDLSTGRGIEMKNFNKGNFKKLKLKDKTNSSKELKNINQERIIGYPSLTQLLANGVNTTKTNNLNLIHLSWGKNKGNNNDKEELISNKDNHKIENQNEDEKLIESYSGKNNINKAINLINDNKNEKLSNYNQEKENNNKDLINKSKSDYSNN